MVQSERESQEVEACKDRDAKLTQLEGSFEALQGAYEAGDTAEFGWMQMLTASQNHDQLREQFDQNELKFALLSEDMRDGPELLTSLSHYVRSFQVAIEGTEQLAKALCVVCKGFQSLQRMLQPKDIKAEAVTLCSQPDDPDAQLLYLLITNLMETQSSVGVTTRVQAYLADQDFGELQGTGLTVHYPALQQALRKQGSPEADRCLFSLILAMSDAEGLLDFLVQHLAAPADCEEELKRLWSFAANPSSCPTSQLSQPETCKVPSVMPITRLLYYGCTYLELVLGSKASLGVYDSKRADAAPVLGLLPSGKLKVRNGEKLDIGLGYADEDKIGILVDLEGQTIRFYKNGTKMEMADIAYPYARAQVRVILQAGGSCSLHPASTLPSDIPTAWLHNSPSTDFSAAPLAKSILQSLNALAIKDLRTVDRLTSSKQSFGLTVNLSERTSELLCTLLKAVSEDEDLAQLLLPLIDLNLRARSKCGSTAVSLLQSLKELSVRDSALGRGCSDVILQNLSLFYCSASERLAALTTAISQSQGVLESRIIARFAETVEMVRLLQGVTQEEWAAFQTLILGDSAPRSLAWSYQKSLFYLLHLSPADEFVGSQVSLYSNSVLMKLQRDLNSQRLPGLQTDLAESLCLLLAVSKADSNQVAALTPLVLDVLTALQHYILPSPDVTLVKTTGQLSVPLTPPASETILSLPLPAGATRVLVKVPAGLSLAVRSHGEWIQGATDISLPEDLAVKVCAGEEEIAAFEVTWESFAAETGKIKTILTKLRLLVSAVSLHHAERLITGTVLTTADVSSDLSKALDSKLVQSGIKEDAWKLLGFTITLPPALDSLFQVLVEPYEPSDMPTYQRSVSMMSPAQYHSEPAGSEGDLLSEYLHSAAAAAKGTYAYDNSLFLESLIEGKGSAAVLWTRVRKQLGLDRKPASSVGGAEGDRTERAILALLLKALRVVADVESLSAESENIPELVPLLWKEALAVRTFLSQKQQDVGELRANVQQLCVLLLHTDIPAFLTHSGVLGVRKQVEASIPLGLRALKRLGSKAIVEDKAWLETYKHALTTVSDFIKAGVSVQDFAKAIETRRNQAISRTLGYALLSLLLKDFQQPHALSTFVSTLSGHYLSGLSGIDPTLRRCLRKQFFVLWEAVLAQASQRLQQRRITVQTCKEGILSLQGLVFPLAQYDYATLAEKPMRPLLSGLLKVAQGQTVVGEEEVETSLCVSGFDSELKPVYGGKPIIALKYGEDVQGWPKVTSGALSISYLQGTGDKYLTGLEEGLPVFTARALLLTRKSRSDPVLAAQKDLQAVAWSTFKHFVYSTAMEKQQGEALESQLVTLLTEQVKKIEVEKSPAALQLAAIPSGAAWTQTTSESPSYFANLQSDSLEKCREVNLLVRRYLYWEENCAAVTPAAVQVLEATTDLQLWTDAQGKCSLEARFAVLKADPKTPDSVKAYLEGAPLPSSETESKAPAPASLSLLWLLQMSPSWGSQRFLGVAEVKERLLCVAFAPNSLVSSLAFRVLRASFIHSKAAVEFTAVPPILAAITEGEPMDMSTALLQLVAVPQASHITWRRQKCSVAKDTVLGFGNEALCFLLSTFESADCQRALLSKAEEAVKGLSQALLTGSWEEVKALFLTLLGFFALLQGQRPNVLQLLKPVANSNLKGLVTAVAEDQVTVLVLETGKFETVQKTEFKERQESEVSTFLEQSRLLDMLIALLTTLPVLDKRQAGSAEVLAACQFRQLLSLKAMALLQELTQNKGLFEGRTSLFPLLLGKLQSIDALVDKRDPIEASADEEAADCFPLEEPSSTDLNNLFKLSKAFALKLVSSSSGLAHYTNQYSQHFLKAKGPAHLQAYWDTAMLKGASAFGGAATVLVALGAETGELQGTMGCRVAGIEVKLEASDQGVACFYDGHVLFQNAPNKQTFRLAVTIHQTGEVQFAAEDQHAVYEVPRPGLYQLLSHPFVFYTESAPAVALRGLSVFEGTVSPSISFFKHIETPPNLRPAATDPRQVFLNLKLPSPGETLGAITGQPKSTLEQALTALVEGHSVPVTSHTLAVSDLVIEDVKLFDSPEQVPSSYITAEYWKDGEHRGVSSQLSGLKVLAYKRTPLHLAQQSVTGFYVKAETEESSGMITVGNMWVDKDQKACLYVLQKPMAGSAKNRLVDFLFIEADSEEEVRIPQGCRLIRFLTGREKQGSTGCPIFNLYPTGSKVLLLAARQYDSLLGFPAQHLHYAPSEETEKPHTEEARPEPTALAQRKAAVYLAGLCSEAQLASSVLRTLGPEAPWEFAAALQDYALFQKLLYAYRKETASLKTLLKVIMANSSFIHPHIFRHSLWQLLHSISRPLSVSEQTPIFVESLHPYENNMNYDQAYIIPGALKLLIEFTPQTKTENNCDVLTFYRAANHQDQICAYSGDNSNFKVLEVKGDSVFLHFRSDGSVVYWGYAFTITPISAVTETVVSVPRDYQLLQPELGLWLLEEVSLPQTAKAGIARLLLCLLHFPLSELPLCRVIAALGKCLSGLEEAPGYLAILREEAESMWRMSERLETSSSTLPALMMHMPLSLLDSWAPAFVDLRFSLRSLALRGSEAEPLLLRHLLHHKTLALSTVLESAHPYAAQTQRTTVSFPGIRHYRIETDEKSQLDPGHDLFVGKSFLPESSAPATTDILTPTRILFARDVVSGTISIIEDGRAILSSGNNWASSIIDKEVGSYQFEATFLVDSSTSDNFGFGVTMNKAKFEGSCCGFPGNNLSPEVYCYQANGYVNGSETSTGIRQGQRVTVSMDAKRLITFKNNGVVVGTPILAKAKKLRIYVTCYGSHKISIESYRDTSSALAHTKNRVYTLSGEEVCISYPVNKAFSTRYEWSKEGSDHLQIATMSAEGWKVCTVSSPMQAGVNVFETRLISVGAEEVQVGVIAEGEPLDQPLNDTNSYSLASTGLCYINSQSGTSQSFTSQDLVTVIWDLFTYTLRFHVNGVEVYRAQLSPQLGKKQFFFAVAFSHPGQTAEIVNLRANPALHAIESQGVAHSWGVKLAVYPEVTGPEGVQVLELLAEDQKVIWEREKTLQCRFSKTADSQLVALIDKQANKSGKSPTDLPAAEVDLSPDALLLYTELEKFQPADLLKRISLLQDFNTSVDSAIELLDLSDSSSDVQKQMLSCKGLLFYAKKSEKLKTVLDQTAGGSTPTISVNRIRANFLRKKGTKDHSCKISVFAQVMASFTERTEKDLWVTDRVFRVDLTGEGATDAGGPYNEIISTMCEEVMSDFLPLFLPSPNNSLNTGLYRDAYLPHPDSTSALHLSMYRFLGLLFGIAIRTQNNLALTFPPLFWKRIAQEPVDLQDLKGIDENCVKALELLRDPKSQNVSEEDFTQLLTEFTFTTKNSAGREIALVPSGKETFVTIDRAQKYADMIEALRLSENLEAYRMIREGLGAIVPLNLLFVMSWNQIETLICGSPEVDVERLKGNTEYEGYTQEDPVIVHFWEVMTEMTAEQRSAFLRFAWGRARLPAAGDFRKFKITKYSCDNSDLYLPLSHTCFFTIDLPPYSTKEVLKNKLLYAVTHCQSIDNDHDGGNWDVEE